MKLNKIVKSQKKVKFQIGESNIYIPLYQEYKNKIGNNIQTLKKIINQFGLINEDFQQNGSIVIQTRDKYTKFQVSAILENIYEKI